MVVCTITWEVCMVSVSVVLVFGENWGGCQCILRCFLKSLYILANTEMWAFLVTKVSKRMMPILFKIDPGVTPSMS